jgi:hypothetical protein
MTTTPNLPRPLWQKFLFAAVVFTGLCVIVGLLLPGEDAGELNAILARLEATDPNWRTGPLAEDRAEIADAENSALVIRDVVALMPKSWPTDEYAKLSENLPLREVVGPLTLAAIQQELAKTDREIVLARKLADLPNGRHRLEIKPIPSSTTLTDQLNAPQVAQLLREDALRLAAENDIAGALRSARGMLNVARSYGDEPFVISQMYRMSWLNLTGLLIERILSMGVPQDEEALAKLEEVLKLEESHPILLLCVRGERAMGIASFELILTNPQQGWKLFSDPKRSWSERIFGVSTSAIRWQQGLWLRLMTDYVEIAKLPVHERSAKESRLFKEINTLPPKAELVKQLLGAIDTLRASCRRHDAHVRVLRMTIAVERFRGKHHRWPDSLADLKQAVPLDPFDGKPLRYRKSTDGVCIYSVGHNRADDAGHLGDRSTAIPGHDIGLFLWNPELRRVEIGLLPRPTPEPAGEPTIKNPSSK